MVTDHIQNYFSFTAIEIQIKDQRLLLESKFIATITQCEEWKQSADWLGNYSPKEKIKGSGLWQVNNLNRIPFSEKEYEVINYQITSINHN